MPLRGPLWDAPFTGNVLEVSGTPVVQALANEPGLTLGGSPEDPNAFYVGTNHLGIYHDCQTSKSCLNDMFSGFPKVKSRSY